MAIVKPYCSERDLHKESTKCKWVRQMNRGIHCKSGTSFMGLPVNACISIWKQEFCAFPHYAHSLGIYTLKNCGKENEPKFAYKLVINFRLATALFDLVFFCTQLVPDWYKGSFVVFRSHMRSPMINTVNMWKIDCPIHLFPI